MNFRCCCCCCWATAMNADPLPPFALIARSGWGSSTMLWGSCVPPAPNDGTIVANRRPANKRYASASWDTYWSISLSAICFTTGFWFQQRKTSINHRGLLAAGVKAARRFFTYYRIKSPKIENHHDQLIHRSRPVLVGAKCFLSALLFINAIQTVNSMINKQEEQVQNYVMLKAQNYVSYKINRNGPISRHAKWSNKGPLAQIWQRDRGSLLVIGWQIIIATQSSHSSKIIRINRMNNMILRFISGTLTNVRRYLAIFRQEKLHHGTNGLQDWHRASQDQIRVKKQNNVIKHI